MTTPPGIDLARLNMGCLPAPTDDPRVAEVMAVPGRVNGPGKRMPGFGRAHRNTARAWPGHACARVTAE